MKPQTFGESAQIGTLIELQRVVLVPDVFEALMANPFWEKRFGERAQTFILQDLHYNLDFLVAAVRLSSPGSLTDYFLWQREMLVARGLCTRHLHETLDEMFQRLVILLPQQADYLAPFIKASYAGFEYSQAGCSALDAIETRVAEAATLRMYPDPQPENEKKRQRCTKDNRFYISYLLDAVAFNQPEQFLAMMSWIAGFLENFGVEMDGFYADIGCLGLEIEQQLPEYADEFISMLKQLPDQG